jgi:hypothetical protein
MAAKALQEPNLSNMLKGLKTIEGRLRTPYWDGLQPGQLVNFYDPDNPSIEYTFQVKNVYYARDFGELYERFGHRLLPQVDSPQAAIDYYSGLAGDTFSPENVAAMGQSLGGFGVVGLEFVLV